MEIWEEFAASYEVSNLGNVRSLKRGKPYTLKLYQESNGYLKTRIIANGCEQQFSVHRLVAKMFVPKPDGKSQVNHINGIKTDNRAENLEWVTPAENSRHAHSMGLAHVPKGEKHPKAKLTNEQVEQLRSSYMPFDKDNGLIALAKKFNISVSVAHDVLHGLHYAQAPGKIHKKANRRLPDEIRDEIRRLYKQNVRGFGIHALAKKFNVSKTTIQYILRETRRANAENVTD